MHYAVHSRPQCVGRASAAPHAADLASDRRDHSDASAACVGCNAADDAPTLTDSLASELVSMSSLEVLQSIVPARL